MLKKGLILVASLVLIGSAFTGCNSSNGESSSSSSDSNAFDMSKNITVISREEGSGTRGAFVELLGIEEKNSDGSKTDRTVKTADITQSTGVMLTSVAQNKYAIGYISLGSLNDTVKALKVDGAEATVANVKSGAYKISRPFNIVTKDGLSEVAQDFIDFILSSEGQKVVEDSGYIAVEEGAAAYSGSRPAGKVTVAGSTSVTPVMEKLKEAYIKVNPNAQIEINPSDSSMGVSNTVDGICDIGMASRAIKDSELEKGVKPEQIAIDGLAVIVNKENTTQGLTQEQICNIYIGQTTNWSDFKG